MFIWFMIYYLAKAFNVLFMIRYGHLGDWPDQHWDVRFQGDLPCGVPKVAQRVPEEQDGRRRSQPLDADRGTGETRLKLWLGLSWWLKLVSRLELTVGPSLRLILRGMLRLLFPAEHELKTKTYTDLWLQTICNCMRLMWSLRLVHCLRFGNSLNCNYNIYLIDYNTLTAVWHTVLSFPACCRLEPGWSPMPGAWPTWPSTQPPPYRSWEQRRPSSGTVYIFIRGGPIITKLACWEFWMLFECS